jgi:hypothetical protein
MKANNPNGRKPITYGGRTFNGWATYYAFWGKRQPSMGTIRDHYYKYKRLGMDEEEIIAAQQKLWRDGITLHKENRAAKANDR